MRQRTRRSRSTTDGGADLGLAITQEIIESHGGTVSLEASPSDEPERP